MTTIIWRKQLSGILSSILLCMVILMLSSFSGTNEQTIFRPKTFANDTIPESNQELPRVINATSPGSDTSGTKPVEIESSFPGGPNAWMRFLMSNFRYPEAAMRNNITGTVIVQFIVAENGKVSDIKAISGPTSGGLREEVVRIIRKSGKWDPAVIDGKPVKSYKLQPITFKTERN